MDTAPRILLVDDRARRSRASPGFQATAATMHDTPNSRRTGPHAPDACAHGTAIPAPAGAPQPDLPSDSGHRAAPTARYRSSPRSVLGRARKHTRRRESPAVFPRRGSRARRRLPSKTRKPHIFVTIAFASRASRACERPKVISRRRVANRSRASEPGSHRPSPRLRPRECDSAASRDGVTAMPRFRQSRRLRGRDCRRPPDCVLPTTGGC